MFVTQPTLTARPPARGGEGGEPLFARTRRGMRLTDAGRAFLPYAERAMRAVRHGRQALTDARSRCARRPGPGRPPPREHLRTAGPVTAIRRRLSANRSRGADRPFGRRLADAAPR